MLKVFLPWIRSIVEDPANAEIFPDKLGSVYILMDNAQWHKKAVSDGLAERMGIPKENFLPHPAQSSDFQAPIEWSHSHLVHAVQAVLQQQLKKRDVKGIKHLVKSTWEGKKARGLAPLLSTEQITKMFDKLDRNYEMVLQADGDWTVKGT